MRGELELRCVCSKHPLLGVCGRDALTGDPFIHVKVFKQGRVFGEMIAHSGPVRIRCRDCLHWNVVTIRGDVSMRPAPLPEGISL